MKPVFILLLAGIVLSCNHFNPKTYQWRGADRSGLFEEENLLSKWPESGPDELWFTEGIGNGFGSPTITEDRIFVTGETDSLTVLFCLDLNGQIRWKTPTGKAWNSHYPGSRSAPTIAGNHIYVITGIGNLFCLNQEKGDIVWSKNFIDDFRGVHPRFGVAEAAVICEDKVFLTPGGKEHNVVALNRYTGELVWSCRGMGERPGYNPGNLIELTERKIFVTFSAYHLLGIDAETGELLWTHLQENTPPEEREPGIGDTHANNIVFDDGFIYYAAGDGNGGVKLQLSEDGSQITEIWRNPGFDSYMGGFVKIGDYLYGCGTRKKNLQSIQASSGEITDSLMIGTGAIIAADERLYYYNSRGEMQLLRFSEGSMKQESIFSITRGTKQHFSHPVIRNGILYQRRGNALMAFDIHGNSPQT